MMVFRMFVYQTTFDTLQLKKDKGTNYVLSWKSKRVYTSKHNPLYTVFLHNTKLSGYRMGIKFDKDPLAVEKNNHVTKTTNAYVIYNSDTWTNNQLRNFTLRNCLFGAARIVKSSNNEKCVYSGYGIAFDGKGTWSIGNDYARNVVTFGVDNSSSSHADNRKNKFLLLGEGDTFGINGSFGAPEKKV